MSYEENATPCWAWFRRPALVLISGAIGASGCAQDEKRPAPTAVFGEAGPAVAVEGQRVTIGFALGHMRANVDVESFRISRHPVTIGEYRACVVAGRCPVPPQTACTDFPMQPQTRRPNFHDEAAAADSAVTCVGLQGARQYCAYVGGSLPTLEEWLLAARGSSPQRYSWGSIDAACAQHAFALPVGTERCSKDRASLGRVGLHAEGASPSGVQDVLLTRGELIDTSEEALYTACQAGADTKPGNDRACIAYGLRPGSIDSVRELLSEPNHPDSTATAYGFRCTWGGAS